VSFDPRRFLSLARRLTTGLQRDDQAILRTAVSRAYYAAFWVARDWGVGHGIPHTIGLSRRGLNHHHHLDLAGGQLGGDIEPQVAIAVDVGCKANHFHGVLLTGSRPPG